KRNFAEGYLKSYYNFYYRKFQNEESRREAAIKLFKFTDLHFVKNKPKEEVLENGIIPAGFFINSINVSLSLNKYLWAEKFIEKNKIYLSELNHDEVYSTTKALIHFHKKDYKSALYWFSKITGKYTQLELNRRIYTTIIYYEMQDSEGIKNQLNNVKTFKKSKKTNQGIVIIINNFLKYFNMLMKIFNMDKNNRREEVMMFKNKLVNDKKWIMKRQWLMDKIEEL
ncbi:MAG: hypothetical protein ABIY50_12380, partial [Ignavibacteria bacterium]